MSFQRDGGYVGLFFSILVHNYTRKCVDPSVSSLHAYSHTVEDNMSTLCRFVAACLKLLVYCCACRCVVSLSES